MLFYPSKNHNSLNKKEFHPEKIGGMVMLNPYYRSATISNREVRALVDSGAFQDIDRQQRLDPSDALDRQLAYERSLRSIVGNNWHFEGVVIYDQMLGVDEQIVDGKKVKVRGSVESAAVAVEETVRAAEVYWSRRDEIAGNIVYVGQGATPTQYVDTCIRPMLDLMRHTDYFAFGGFCIIGKQRSLKPVFMETFERALPLLKKCGITRVHLLGVCVADMVRFAAECATKHRMTVSTDSSSIEVNSVMGRVWSAGRWLRAYAKEEKYVAYHPCDLAHENIRAYHEWSYAL